MSPVPNCCVACDRPAGTAGTCPYCGEAVYEARSRRIVRQAAILTVIVGLPLFAYGRGCGGALLKPVPRTFADGLMLALGTGLLMLPGHLDGVSPASRAARLRQVWRPLGNSLASALATWLYLLAARHGTGGWPPRDIALAAILPAAFGALAFSFGRSGVVGVLAGGLLAAGWKGFP